MRYAITNSGYRMDSPDRYNDFNIIPSNNITMEGVNFPILGVDNKGNTKIMQPGKSYKFKGSQVTEIPLRKGGEMKKYQYAGEWSPGMMFDPNAGDIFNTEFKPQPIQMPSKFQFDNNQKQIDESRAPQISQMLRDQVQMVNPITRPMEEVPEFNIKRPEIDNTIKVPSNIPGVQNKPKEEFKPWYGIEYAMAGLAGLGLVNNILNDKPGDYERYLQKSGNTNNLYSPQNSNADYGNYTLNTGVGSNFRPRYQDGGEYDLTEEEIERLREEGYDVEFL